MVKFGLQLALDSQGNHVSAKTSTKDDGPFKCVICEKELSLRAGSKTPHHFIHRVKSSCEGNTDEHRTQAESIGSIVQNETEICSVEPEEVESSFGSTVENEAQGSSVEPVDDLSNGSTDENQDQNSAIEPMDICDDSIDQVLSELIPVESLVEPSIKTDETNDPEVPDIEDEEPVPVQEISNDIIEEALEFVVTEILDENKKCTDCKAKGTDFHKMFTQEARERFELNDLYVCDACVVRCPSCDGPNSTKRAKRTPLCFTCDFEENQWRGEATRAVEKMESIPDSPKHLEGRRAIMVIKMLKRKRMARTIYNFMFAHRSRVPEFRRKVGEVLKAKKIAKQLMKVRKASDKSRLRNLQRRESSMGTDGSARLIHMYANRRETCFSCGKQNRRRYMMKYASVMGSFKYSCKSCSKTCQGCDNPCTKNDMDKFGDQCFECLSWSSTRSDEWKTNQKAVLDACLQGNKWAWAVLYLNAPGIKRGKFSGDSLVHVPSVDLDSVIRRDHPEYKEIAEVIKVVRKM